LETRGRFGNFFAGIPPGCPSRGPRFKAPPAPVYAGAMSLGPPFAPCKTSPQVVLFPCGGVSFPPGVQSVADHFPTPGLFPVFSHPLAAHLPTTGRLPWGFLAVFSIHSFPGVPSRFRALGVIPYKGLVFFPIPNPMVPKCLVFPGSSQPQKR